MSAPHVHRGRRLAAVLSLRTISGKLIVGLVVLLGAASIIVSVVTAQSLNNSLMSSLNTELQAASMRWQNCVFPPQGNHADAYTDTDSGLNCYGQATGTFQAELTGRTFSNLGVVPGGCQLSAADEKTLLALPTAPLPPGGQYGPGGQGGPGATSLPTHTVTLTSLNGEYLLTKVQASSDDVLITGLPLATVDNTLNYVENTEHVVFAAVLLLAVVLGAGLIQVSLRPLRRVAATATRVTELPLDSGEVTLPAGVPDTDPRTEVGRVGAAFNRMLFHVERALGRRAASEARLRRFAADASHELRTPLSAIRGYAELALRHQGPVPEDVTHALRRVQSESARMTVLVDDLLLLARLDAGRPLEREPVDLSRLDIFAKHNGLLKRWPVLAFQAIQQSQALFDFGEALGRSLDPSGIIAQRRSYIFHTDACRIERRERFLKLGLITDQFLDVLLRGAKARRSGGIALIEQVEGVDGRSVNLLGIG